MIRVETIEPEREKTAKEIKKERRVTRLKSQKNFEKTIQKIIDDDSGILKDVKVDDSDFKTAPNFFKWCLGKNYLKQDPKPYAKQFQIGLHLFADFCPNPRCTDIDYVIDIPVDDQYDDIREKVTLFRWGKCPRCGKTRTEAFAEKNLFPYKEFAGLAGQRSGKSFLSGLAFSYTAHRFIKLQNPSRYFGLAPTILHGTFVALTATQAKKTLWDPFNELLVNAPWFKEYHAFLKDKGDRAGEQYYRHAEEFINYRHRGLLINPAAPNTGALRGLTRFMAGIDEIGLFDNSENNIKVKMNAEEVYTSLKNSFRTLRSAADRLVDRGMDDVPQPLFFNISSPFSKMDKIVDLYKQSRKSRIIYGIHYATWEMNPTIKKRDLRDEFSKHPQNAWRDFGAVPPLSGNSFISKIKHFEGVIGESMKNSHRITPVLVETESRKLLTSGKLRQVWSDKSVPKIMAIDAGESLNSFAFAVGHVNETTDEPEFDMLGEIPPVADHPVSFADVYHNVLKPIVDDMNVVMVVSDRWQNKLMISNLEYEMGIIPDEYSVKYTDFTQWREALYNSEFKIPKPEISFKEIKEDGPEHYPDTFKGCPIAHFIFQCLTVTDIEGKSVVKTGHLQDDIFRAVVLAYSYLTNPETRHRFMGLLHKRGAGSAYGVSAGVLGSSGAASANIGTNSGLANRIAVAKATGGNISTGKSTMQGFAVARGSGFRR